MDWGRFFMDWGWLVTAIPLIALVITTITDIKKDNKKWGEFESKIGNTERGSLTKQHDSIEKTVSDKAEHIKEIQNKEFGRIYAKVDNIDKEVYSNKERYQNLNLNQREIKNNLDKLVYEWQSLIAENKELKKEMEILQDQNNKLLGMVHRQGRDREDEWEPEL